MRVLELYSGVGGMHFSLCHLPEAEVVAAVDISPLPNAVYAHNFPHTLLLEKGVEGLNVQQLDRLNFEMLLMSPPCQPFTRLGKKKDENDPRTKSFFYLLDLLKKLKNPPTYILLENVKGFEDSQTFSTFNKTLSELSYHQQGFLISPKHFGIPNSRLRYYHLAVRKPLCFNKEWFQPDSVLYAFPISDDSSRADKSSVKLDDGCVKCKALKKFLEEVPFSQYEIPEDVRRRYWSVMDIVTPHSTQSTCFTKAYGKYFEGTGSVLKLPTDDCPIIDHEQLSLSQDDRLRFFSPREIANLMGFPKNTFSFPDNINVKQRYRLLGNSLNVHVVAQLIKLLVQDVS